MAVIELAGVVKNYHLGETTVPALRGVDLTINAGDFAAVWGPSGSGKSSLLNMIGLLDRPDRGEIHLHGRRTAGLSDREQARLRNQSIGFVFQNFNLMAVLSALENVMLPLLIRGSSRKVAQAAAERRLIEVGIMEHAQHRPDQLSGGQRQRVAIARALVTEPQLVIADEPTANLDAHTSLDVIRLMRELNHAQQVTFLFSTHDPRLIDAVDRLIPLVDGQIVTEGELQ
jgi:putative ABC transport system ATP-binding protein